MLDLDNLPKDKSILLIPVFYLHLDPSLIPDPDALDTAISTSIMLPCIDAASMSLHALGSLIRIGAVPVDAYPHAWPRVWRWIEFFHTYSTCLPGFIDSAEIACVEHSIIISRLRTHPELSNVVSTTRGVRHIIATAWVHLLYNDSPTALHELPFFLGILADGIKDMSNFEEILDGVGGCEEDLASAVLKHISRGLPVVSDVITASRSNPDAASLAIALQFLDDSVTYNSLHLALLAQGIVGFLISVLATFNKTINSLTRPVVYVAFFLLAGYLQTGNLRIVEGLQAGLL